MDTFTIAGALKRKGITQREVVETLAKKYNLNISQGQFNVYAKQYICGDTQRWKIIRECLENEFGIVYKPTCWN